MKLLFQASFIFKEFQIIMKYFQADISSIFQQNLGEDLFFQSEMRFHRLIQKFDEILIRVIGYYKNYYSHLVIIIKKVKRIMSRIQHVIDLTIENSESIYISDTPFISQRERQQNMMNEKKKTIFPSYESKRMAEQSLKQTFGKSQNKLQSNQTDQQVFNNEFYFNKKGSDFEKGRQNYNSQADFPPQIQLFNQQNFHRPSNTTQYQMMNMSWNQFYNQPESILYYNPFSPFNFRSQPQNIWQNNSMWTREGQNQQNLFDNVLNKKKEKMCEICFEHSSESYLHDLFNCQHSYHQHCLQKVIEFKVQQRKFPLKCPDDSCGKIISEQNIKYILSSSQYQKYKNVYLKYELQKNSHLYFWCQTPDCQSYIEKSMNGSSFFKCEKCQVEYCISCDKVWHYGPCNMSQVDEQFLRFAKKKLFKTCPRCRKLVQKISGCHHIVCICKFQFCYICEKDYRNQCKCKSLSFGEHRILMSNQRKQQQEIAKKQAKLKREEEKFLKKIKLQAEKEERKKRQEQKRLQRLKLAEQNKSRKGLREESNIEVYQRKPRKVVKKNFHYEQ